MKSYAARDLRYVPHIEFEIAGQVFRVPHKQRPDVVNLAASGVTVVNGEKRINLLVAQQCITNYIADRVWDPEAPVLDADGAPVMDPAGDGVSDPVPRTGAWVEVDDKVRWVTLCRNPEYRIDDDVLGDLLNDLTEAVAQVPTGASR